MSDAEKKGNGEGMSFEAALKRLEAIVREMESGEIELDAMIAAFEEGQRLVKLCTEKLDAVEKKIEKLTAAPGGGIRPVPYDPENPDPAPAE